MSSLVHIDLQSLCGCWIYCTPAEEPQSGGLAGKALTQRTQQIESAEAKVLPAVLASSSSAFEKETDRNIVSQVNTCVEPSVACRLISYCPICPAYCTAKSNMKNRVRIF